jgi:hypothetical protein
MNTDMRDSERVQDTIRTGTDRSITKCKTGGNITMTSDYTERSPSMKRIKETGYNKEKGQNKNAI